MRGTEAATPEEIKVIVPLRISWAAREHLREHAEIAKVSANQLLIDTLKRGGLDLS